MDSTPMTQNRPRSEENVVTPEPVDGTGAEPMPAPSAPEHEGVDGPVALDTPPSRASRIGAHRRAMSARRRARLARTITWATIMVVGVAVILGLVTRPSSTAAESVALQSTPSSSPSPSSTAESALAANGQSSAGPEGDAEADDTSEGAASATEIERGTGTFSVLPVPGSDSTATGRQVRYTVEVERGLKLDTAEFASTVRTVLTDSRGWETQDNVHFVNVSPAKVSAGAKVDVHVTLASPDTVDRECAPLRTLGKVSCHKNGRVMLNALRWIDGASSYGKDIATYRVYLVNHEVGHSIGHSHVQCPAAGAKAPVMVQQTLGLQGCTPWPYPVRS